MSDIGKTIERLESWINVRPSDPAGFIADLRALLNTAKAAQRAAEVLEKAQRHSLDPHGDFYQGESMVSNDIGDWVEFDDVAKAIQILQEGRQ